MKPKKKKCKGTGKAKGHGCSKNVYLHRFGLCKNCFNKWLLTTQSGNEYLRSISLKVQMPRIQSKRALAEARTQTKGKRTIQHELNNTKTVVHEYIRKRDKHKPCISCGVKWDDSFQAGHHYSASGYKSMKFNLDNIHGQCPFCNQYKDGNFDNYSLRLPGRIGQKRYDRLKDLAILDKQIIKRWTRTELKQIRKEAKLLLNKN